MKKEDELIRNLNELIKETQNGKIFWDVRCQTTEYNDRAQKPVVEEDGRSWIVDECFVSYHCMHKGKEFLMITYEMLHTSGNLTKTTNLIFLPPLGIRYFDIHVLLPYSVEASQVLVYNAHMLWMTILELKKKNPELVDMDASERVLEIEEDMA